MSSHLFFLHFISKRKSRNETSIGKYSFLTVLEESNDLKCKSNKNQRQTLCTYPFSPRPLPKKILNRA